MRKNYLFIKTSKEVLPAGSLLNFCRTAFNYTNVIRRSGLRFFSERKVFFSRELNAAHIGVFMFKLSTEDIVESLGAIQKLENKYANSLTVSSEDDVSAYSLKKKLLLKISKIVDSVPREIGKLDNLVIILASKPDWIVDNEELVELLDELKETVSGFFFATELLRLAGDPFVRGRYELATFSTHNKLFKYSAEVKASIGLLSISLKKNLPYLNVILKEVQRRWGWLSVLEREALMVRLGLINAEKKKISKERKIARKKHDKLVKAYVKLLKGL